MIPVTNSLNNNGSHYNPIKKNYLLTVILLPHSGRPQKASSKGADNPRGFDLPLCDAPSIGSIIVNISNDDLIPGQVNC